MQAKDNIKNKVHNLGSALPQFGHVLPLIVVSTAFVGLAIWAAQISGLEGSPLFSSWDFLAVILSLGALVFSAVISFYAIQTQKSAQTERERAQKDVNQVRQELNLAQAMLKAEPQLLMLWDEKGQPNLIIHTLDTDTGIPFHFQKLFILTNGLNCPLQ